MKRIAAITVLILAAMTAFAQGVRVDVPLWTSGPSVPVSGGPLPQTLLLANSTVNICVHPATASSCTPITTYTDVTLTTACPPNSPIVQLPGTACVQTTGPRGNLGFWYSGGVVDYFVHSSYGSFGPFTTSGGTTGPVGPTGPTGPQGPPGTGNITAGQLALGQYPTSSASTISPSNFTYDADTGNNLTVPGTVAMSRELPSIPPVFDVSSPVFDSGTSLICNGNGSAGSHDMLTPVQNALNAHTAGGTVRISLVGTESNPCYISNPAGLTYPSQAVTYQISGPLFIGSTLLLSTQVSIEGNGGLPVAGQYPTWRQGGIQLTNTLGSMTGTLGVSVSGTPTTPASATIPLANIGGMVTGDFATVTDQISCTISSITRLNNLVTAQMSSKCTIAPGQWNVVIAGVSDSSFNGTFTITSNDFNSNNICPFCMTWPQTGSNGTSSGGTATETDSSTFEAVGPFTCNGSGCTASFYRTHSSSAYWAIDAVAISYTGAGPGIKDMSITNFYGSGLDLQGAYYTTLFNTTIESVMPVSIDHSSYPSLEYSDVIQLATSGTVHNPPYGLRFWNRSTTLDSNNSGNLLIRNSTIWHGILMDYGAQALTFQNSISEAPHGGAITFDGTLANHNGIANVIQFIQDSQQQDATGGDNLPWIYYPYSNTTVGPTTSVYICNLTYSLGNSYNNNYFDGIMHVCPGQSAPLNFGPTFSPNVLGTWDDGRNLIGPWDGNGVGIGPFAVPFGATSNIVQNPSSWTNGGGLCTVTAGGINPLGQQDALVGSVASTGNCTSSVGSVVSSVTPHVGDAILFGGWTYAPDWAQRTGLNGGYRIVTPNAAHMGISTNPFTAPSVLNLSAVTTTYQDSNIPNQGWHKLTGLAFVTFADGTSGQTISMFAQSATSGHTENFWNPRALYIPSVNFTATTDGTTAVLTSVSGTTCTVSGNCTIYPGQEIYCASSAGIPAHSYVTNVNSGAGTVTINAATTGAGASGAACYTQVPMRELYRWKTYLLSGSTPTNWNHPGVAATLQPVAVPQIIPTVIYSAAGTALPSCTASLNGTTATVSDATSPTYRGSYTSGGTVTTIVQCDGGSTTWLTH